MRSTLKKIALRGALFTAVGIALTQMLPSLAEQLTPETAVEVPVGAETTETSPGLSDTSTVTSLSSPEPTASITYLNSEPPTVKASIIAAPNLFFRTPNSVLVDPRATYLRFNSVALGGAGNILICATSTVSPMLIQPHASVFVSGQGTRNLMISGKVEDVLSSFTSGAGLSLQGGGKISGSGIFFGVSALSKPAVDPILCEGPQVTRFVAVTALGIDLNLVKAPVDLNKQ